MKEMLTSACPSFYVNQECGQSMNRPPIYGDGIEVCPGPSRQALLILPLWRQRFVPTGSRVLKLGQRSRRRLINNTVLNFCRPHLVDRLSFGDTRTSSSASIDYRIVRVSRQLLKPGIDTLPSLFLLRFYFLFDPSSLVIHAGNN